MDQETMKQLGLNFEVINLGPPAAVLAAEARVISECMQENAEFRHGISLICGELIGISWADPTDPDDEDREAFLDAESKPRVRELGEKLHEVGGLALMRWVHSHIGQLVKAPVDMRILEFAWDGIGDWRC